MSSGLPGARGVEGTVPVSDRNVLITFRGELYECFERRADALFELTDAVLTGPDRVWSLVELSQEKVFRRGHGALYDGLACGRVDTEAVGQFLAGAWVPLDAVRIGPDEDATVVGVDQVDRVRARLAAAGGLAGGPAPLFVSAVSVRACSRWCASKTDDRGYGPVSTGSGFPPWWGNEAAPRLVVSRRTHPGRP